MKIVIINSPVFESGTSDNTEDYLPPLGLGIIASAIKNRDDVTFIDALTDNYGVENIIEAIADIKPNYIGINIFTTNYRLIKQIVEKTMIEVHWIIGGISTKSLYKEIFTWQTENPIDIVYGDGEYIMTNIINSTISQNPNDSKGNRRFYIIPPDSKYYSKDISGELLDRSLFKNEPQINFYGEKEVCIYTSRGCPYDCTNCAAAWSRNRELGGIRRKTPQSIISELEKIETMYHDVVTIRVLDDLFLSRKQNFVDAISIFNNFKFRWRAMCHIKSITNVDDVILSNIAKSGCKELFVGIESGSPPILKKIHKTDDIDLIIKSINRILNSGINVKGYFICGFPNEKIEDLEKTLELATALKNLSIGKNVKFRNSTFQYRPYYGTELYDEIVKDNCFPYGYILNSTKPSDILNKEVRNKSYNFDSGNYSAASDDALREYIKKINDLNE